MEGAKGTVCRIKICIFILLVHKLKLSDDFFRDSIFVNRFSSIVKTRGVRLSLEKKQKLREDLKRVKGMSRAIKAEKEAQKQAKKDRRRENLKRAAENQRKSEVVQVVSIIRQ